MKTGAQRAAIFSQTLDDVGALLRYHDGGLGDDDDDQQGQRDDDDESTHGFLRFSLLGANEDRKPFDPFDCAAFAASQWFFANVARVQDVPRNSALPIALAAMFSAATAVSPTRLSTLCRGPPWVESQEFFTKQPEGKN